MLKKLTCLLLILTVFLSACAPVAQNPDDATDGSASQESSSATGGSNAEEGNNANQEEKPDPMAELAELLKVDDYELYKTYAYETWPEFYKYIYFHEGTNPSDYDGYFGKPFTVEGMVHHCLYAVDDGTVTTIVAKPISDFEYTSEHFYYVLEEEPRKVWRTDYYGKSHEVVYESTYGDITQIQHFGKVADEKLFVLEGGNRVVVYDFVTKKVTVLLEAYSIEQFYYSPTSTLFERVLSQYVGKGEHGPVISWEGIIREGVPVKEFGVNNYYTLLLKNQHWVL